MRDNVWRCPTPQRDDGGGVYPSVSKSSMASIQPRTIFFKSIAPRPHTKPSWVKTGGTKQQQQQHECVCVCVCAMYMHACMHCARHLDVSREGGNRPLVFVWRWHDIHVCSDAVWQLRLILTASPDVHQREVIHYMALQAGVHTWVVALQQPVELLHRSVLG